MKAFQLIDSGQPARITEIATPRPGPGEILLRIAACGLNFADLLMIQGRYQDNPVPPFTLGMEMAGIVAGLGAGVQRLALGDRVVVFAGQGGLAEYGCFAAEHCIRLPGNMSLTQAAGFQVVYGTSHLALHHRARVAASDTVLVLGAAGGVGLSAVELAKLAGARVIAVARGADKLEIAGAAGADHLIDSDTGDIRAQIKALGGADIVYDPVGGDLFRVALRACNPGARIIVIGFASGDIPQIPANILLVKNLTVIGFYWGGYSRFDPRARGDSMQELMGWFRRGCLRPHISHVLPLEQVAHGLELLRSRRSTGKIVITPQPAPRGG